MTCDFKPGDEVVYIGRTRHDLQPAPLGIGSMHVVEWVGEVLGDVCVMVPSITDFVTASSFRKVQRRNLTEWLSQKTKFEEPKRVGENA